MMIDFKRTRGPIKSFKAIEEPVPLLLLSEIQTRPGSWCSDISNMGQNYKISNKSLFNFFWRTRSQNTKSLPKPKHKKAEISSVRKTRFYSHIYFFFSVW